MRNQQTIKDLVLALNLKSKKELVRYNLSYTYIFSDKKDCLYFLVSILTYTGGKFYYKKDFSNNIDVIEWLLVEMKKYTGK